MPTTKLTNADEFGELPPGFARDGDHVRNPDGSLRVHHDFSDVPANHTVFITGPIGGLIPMADGTTYDVTPAAIAVHDDHVVELHRAIHREHHAAGRFLDVPVPE